jgi:large subunit ribosomal protein L19
VSHHQLIQELEKQQMKKEMPLFSIGDTVDVHVRIIEGGKERIQVFNGIVIARKGKGISETFTVYRNAYGSSMERVFLIHSPRVAKVTVVRRGKVRRAKLYYLRGRTGKAAKVEDMIMKKVSKEPVATIAKETPTQEEKTPISEE